MAIRAVLFDWRGTLVADPPDEWWLGRALQRLNREWTASKLAALCEGLAAAYQLVEAADALLVGDSPTNDGAAARLGILTLILPAYDGLGPRGLDRVLRLV